MYIWLKCQLSGDALHGSWSLLSIINTSRSYLVDPNPISVTRAWQPNVNFAVSCQTVNRRLVARAYGARRMVSVPRLTVRAKLVRRHWAQKHINRPLRPMATCHLLRRKSIHALPDRQSDLCSKTGWRSHE